MENLVNDIKVIIAEVKEDVDIHISKKMDLEKCERIVEKLNESCEECQHHLIELKSHFIQLKENVNRLGDTEHKQHKQFIQNIVSHLQKKHKFVTEGYYFSIYLSMGISLGVAFGLTIFDNIGLGIPIGMSIGLAIGMGLDADAKKKGRTI